MQEHCTKVELYGRLAEMAANQQTIRFEGLSIVVRRNEKTGTKTFMIVEREGAILGKFEVLDIEGDYREVTNG